MLPPLQQIQRRPTRTSAGRRLKRPPGRRWRGSVRSTPNSAVLIAVLAFVGFVWIALLGGASEWDYDWRNMYIATVFWFSFIGARFFGERSGRPVHLERKWPVPAMYLGLLAVHCVVFSSLIHLMHPRWDRGWWLVVSLEAPIVTLGYELACEFSAGQRVGQSGLVGAVRKLMAPIGKTREHRHNEEACRIAESRSPARADAGEHRNEANRPTGYAENRRKSH